jgi:hypothetical protein
MRAATLVTSLIEGIDLEKGRESPPTPGGGGTKMMLNLIIVHHDVTEASVRGQRK